MQELDFETPWQPYGYPASLGYLGFPRWLHPGGDHLRVLVPALGMPFSGCTRRQQARHVRCVHGGVAYASLFNRSDALLLTKRQDFGRSGVGFCACSARSLDFSCTPPQRGTRHGQAPATGQNRPQDRLRGTRRYFVQASSILPQCVEIVC